jgi:AraC-like DNA-binding protein
MRTRKTIDLIKLKNLMKFNPTLSESAGFFDCSEDTISRFVKKEEGLSFWDFRKKYFGSTQIKLRQKAIQMAMSGDRALMIFLLKNFCGLKDNPEIFLEQNDVELEFIDDD